MNRLEQRCKGVQRVLEDYNIPFKIRFENEGLLSIKDTWFKVEVTNRYITINRTRNRCDERLFTFEGITEFRNFMNQYSEKYKRGTGVE